jgi:excisionase family DNA binding protein
MSRLIDIDELADYLKLKKQTIYNWLNQRKISGIKVGGVWRFDRKDIDNWLRSKKRESALPTSSTQGDGA